MAELRYLVIHCTATPEGREVTSDEIRNWHTRPKWMGGRGWKQVGYSDMIHLDGGVENLVPYNEDDVVDPWEITNGVAGKNNVSRHVVYVGGVDGNNQPKDTRTEEQKEALARYVKEFRRQHPEARIVGHNELAAKACPSFDVRKWLYDIGVNPR